MRVLTVSNLYPRPDQPQRGLFNAQQFRSLAEALECGSAFAKATADTTRNAERGPAESKRGLVNLCLVPEWRAWRWQAIRNWSDPFDSRLNTTYLPAFYFPVVGRHLNWRTYLSALGVTRPLFEECDAVLATWLYPDAVAAAEMARRCSRPFWIKVHGSDRFHLRSRSRRRAVIAACDAARGVICVSRSVAEDLAAGGVKRDQLVVVPNGVDATLFRHRDRGGAWQALSSRASSPVVDRLSSPRIVLFVGNLVPVKGPDILLDAWQRLKASSGGRTGISRQEVSGGLRLVVIGEGPMKKDLLDRAARLGVAGTVEFMGSRPHDEIALWMNAADCLCLTSRSEGMPNVVIEALACGLPVVATDVGSCRELLANEPSARVVAAGVSDASLPDRIAAALQDLLEAHIDREQMARRHAGLSWQTSAVRILELLKRG